MSVVALSQTQTQLHFDAERRKSVVGDAYLVTASPHEWVWTPEQQAEMARFCLWAEQRLAAIEQCLQMDDLKHESNSPV